VADVSDVEQTLVNLAALALYPTPPGTSTTPSPVTGAVTSITRGDPLPDQLDPLLVSGNVLVTVNARPFGTHLVPVSLSGVQTVATIPATLTVSVAGNNVATFGGTVTVGQTVTVVLGNSYYSYAPVLHDTPTIVATQLAALIPGATSSGTALTVNSVKPASIRLQYTGTQVLPQRRQVLDFVVRVYTSQPTLRDTTAKAIDQLFVQTRRPVLTDQTIGLLRYSGTAYNNVPERDNLFERALIYCVEWDTVVVTVAYAVTTLVQTVTDSLGDSSVTLVS